VRTATERARAVLGADFDPTYHATAGLGPQAARARLATL
jgi:hypothetical protein